MRKALLAAFLILSSCVRQAPSRTEVLPVTGTWVNLSWQDERNNYMNPRDDAANTDPALWSAKMHELHEIGVDYIVIMQLADGGRAFYPSAFMPCHYPSGRKSPVEAILDACDSLGMHVFLSCGWAFSQDDAQGDGAVVERECRIMDEIGPMFASRPSFYGWYLPVEDCLIPWLPDRSIDGINSLVSRAKALTPGKRTMIAPYGIFGAALDDHRFAEQLSRIDVDIVAYQDEVGCVRERFPMRRMKENFRKLGRMHQDLDIEFWVDLEAFTWDRETNSRFSALIPAEFGRVLSQMAGASQAGASRILSFAVCGIVDKPGSRYPLGQPVEASRVYADYGAWLQGDTHWKVLESVFTGDARNDAMGCTVDRENASILFDGRFGNEDPGEAEWYRCVSDIDVTVDLGSVREVGMVAPRFIHYAPLNVRMPSSVEVWTSLNGEDFSLASSSCGPHAVNDRHDCWTDVVCLEDIGPARYLRVKAVVGPMSFVCCDEVLVHYARH